MRTPVLFLIFNRPDTTARVLEAIRAARPERLYVAADGPRNAAEAERCAAARRAALRVDWPCEVRQLFRERNLGCRTAVSEAITWFFSQEEEGIILEDDCLPSRSFFPYCEELLARYRNDERVLTIGGNNYQRGARRGSASYYATKYFHCWGWATWRRAWALYDGTLDQAGRTLQAGLARLSDGSAAFPRYWMRIYHDCRAGERFSSWAYPMQLTCFARSAAAETLHLAPQVNLVANIGFDTEATHRSGGANPAPAAAELDGPLVHPAALARDIEADRFTDRRHFGISWPGLVKGAFFRALADLRRR